MFNFIPTVVTYLFPGGRALKLVKTGIDVTNMINPLVLTKNITLTVLQCCAPPPIRLAAHCVAASALICSSVVSPNPVTIGLTIHLVTVLYSEC